MGLQVRPEPEAAVPGQSIRADSRADVQEDGGEAVFNKAKVIVTLGNRAVHGARAISTEDAYAAALARIASSVAAI
ncbi:MAG TPA: hypothetical protein VFS24_07655 [Steroidobacteraceae bacterium]|nr:hypothetical protein [Steroidobacteraceae bacterium]